jgi:hypothetical protein
MLSSAKELIYVRVKAGIPEERRQEDEARGAYSQKSDWDICGRIVVLERPPIDRSSEKLSKSVLSKVIGIAILTPQQAIWKRGGTQMLK